MSTGAAFANVTPKKLLGYQDFGDRILDYMRARTREATNLAFSTDGVFVTGLTLSANGADKFQIGGTSKATDGLGNILAASNAQHTAIQFENTISVPYYVGLRYIEIPDGVIINPRTGMPDFLQMIEWVGESGAPDSVTDNGNGTLTFRCDSVCESGVSNAGRQVLVYKNAPGKNATTAALALETCTVAFTGGQNRITTAANFGQSTSSTTASDYTVVLLGPTVKRNTDLRASTVHTFVGIVTGAGAGVAPSVFSTTDQNVIGISLSQFADVTRLDTHGRLKIQVRADASDSGEDQIRVQNFSGTTTFKVDENGNVTIGGNLTVQGTTTQQNVVQVNSSETITDNLTAGDASTDTHTIKGTWQHLNAAGSSKYFYVNGSTGRIGVGAVDDGVHTLSITGTTLGTSTTTAPAGMFVGTSGYGVVGTLDTYANTNTALSTSFTRGGVVGVGISGQPALAAYAPAGGYGLMVKGQGASYSDLAAMLGAHPDAASFVAGGIGAGAYFFCNGTQAALIVNNNNGPTFDANGTSTGPAASFTNGSTGAAVKGFAVSGAGVVGQSVGVGIIGTNTSDANTTTANTYFTSAGGLLVGATASKPTLAIYSYTGAVGIVVKGSEATEAQLTTALGNWNACQVMVQRTIPAAYFESDSTIATFVSWNIGSGVGVTGINDATGVGVQGQSPSGVGVFGLNGNLSAPNTSTAKTAGASSGVLGATSVTGAAGVYGYNLSASGAASHGVVGQTTSTSNSVGVLGFVGTLANANTSIANIGTVGVYGYSGTVGVAGASSANSAPGVFGGGGGWGGGFAGGSKFYSDVQGLISTHLGSGVIAYTAQSSTDSSGVYGRHGANNTSTHGIFGEHEGVGNGVTGKSSSGPGGNFSSTTGAAAKLTSNATRGHFNLSGSASPTTPLTGDLWWQSTGGANLLRFTSNGTNYYDVTMRHLSAGYTSTPVGASSASWTAGSLDSVTLPTTGELHGRMYCALQMFNNTGSSQTQTISMKWGANTLNNFSLTVASSASPTLAIVECEFQIKSDGSVNAASSLQYGSTAQTSFANLTGASGTNQFTISGTNSANNANLYVIRQRQYVEFIGPSSQGRVA